MMNDECGMRNALAVAGVITRNNACLPATSPAGDVAWMNRQIDHYKGPAVAEHLRQRGGMAWVFTAYTL